jgi:hypothetical protein
MTFERKIVVGLDDIAAVSFECKQCQTRVTMLPDDIQVPQRCQKCDSVWIIGDPSNYQSVTSPHMNFINAIGQIRKHLKNGAPFKILLEFNETDENPKGSK